MPRLWENWDISVALTQTGRTLFAIFCAQRTVEGFREKINIEHRTSNIEWWIKKINVDQRMVIKYKMARQRYDLEERLHEFSVRIIKIIEQLPNTRTGDHVAGRLLSIGNFTLSKPWWSPGSGVPKDFVHRLRISLKELRGNPKMVKTYSENTINKKAWADR